MYGAPMASAKMMLVACGQMELPRPSCAYCSVSSTYGPWLHSRGARDEPASLDEDDRAFEPSRDSRRPTTALRSMVC
eukprot:scaffold46372_cov72-Phaeocystis_antarctica.AAC.3